MNWPQRAPGRSGPACQVAFSEAKGNWAGEIPDATGFRTAAEDEGSVVVEVKVSISDYMADRGKAHRQDGALGMGLYRYYMAPEGVISVADLLQGLGARRSVAQARFTRPGRPCDRQARRAGGVAA